MRDTTRIAVASPSFSANKTLIAELASLGCELDVNVNGIRHDEGSLIDLLRRGRFEVLVAGLDPVTENVVRACPDLRLVAKYGVGLDNIDATAMARAGVQLGWTPGVNRRSVSELALGFALGHMRRIFSSVSSMKRGDWIKNGGYTLSGKTFGIVGFGNIGQDLAALLVPFGCRVLVNDIEDRRPIAASCGAVQVSYQELLGQSDIVSFHVPLTSQSRGMFGPAQIELTRPGALIINTARGGVCVTDACAKAVASSRLGGYCADVFEEEPYRATQWSGVEGLNFTPHIGGNAQEAVLAMGRSAIEHIRGYLAARTAGAAKLSRETT